EAVKENINTNEQILFLDVENQGDLFAACNIIDATNPNGIFRVISDPIEKNCLLFLNDGLDREKQDRYNLTVAVEQKAKSNRRKRQAQDQSNTYLYNTWPRTQIIIDVLDANDNAPVWTPVKYPVGTTPEKIFITAISADAPANALVAGLTATDIDIGRNGEVRYDITLPRINPPPFDIEDVEGYLTTTMEFPESVQKDKTLPYKLDLVAYDRSIEEPFQSTEINCYVNLIRDTNRFILVVKNKSMNFIVENIEEYREALQEAINEVVLIERIQASRRQEGDQILIESQW
ncbi:hypothetical protein EGW08_009686, partial [Elysia chlorotica]